MGLTYQELKRLGTKSIVLEKQGDTDVQQNSSGYCSKKRRLIREKFYREQPKETESHSVGKYILKKRDKLDSAKGSETISKLCLHSLVLKEKQNKNFEEKVDKTSMHLDYLQQVINNEIEKLKNQRSNLILKMKEEKVNHNEDFTWAENLANNCQSDRRPVNIAKEKFSAQHQGVFTSPRYGSNQDVALRPRRRSIASQINTLPMDADKGAVGDHNSFNSFNKVRGSSKSVIDALLTPSIHRKQDQIVNCCCNHTFQPVAGYYNTAGVVCHHRNIQQSSVEPHREYKYCCNEYCYNYNPCNQSPAPCYCATPASSKHINIGACRSCYARHGTDIKTDKFYCRSKSKSERVITANRHKHLQETCEAYGERKKRECREKQYRKREKLQRNLSREPMLPNGSMMVQHLDRYVDERKKCVESVLKKHKKLAGNLYEDSSTSTVKISSESKVCHITVQRKSNKHYDNASIDSRYSVETLRMLKRMKIRKYVASKPNSREKEKDETARHVQKMKKYQEYLEKYRNEERSSIVKQSPNEPIQILKEPPKVFAAPDSEHLLQQQRTSRNVSLSNEQPKTNRQQRESSFSKESTEESINKRKNAQILRKDEKYEEFRYEYGAEKSENSVSVPRDSKVLEKLSTKTHRESKDNDDKESKDQEKKRCYKHRSSRDNERESIVYKDLNDREIRNSSKDRTDGVQRATYDNYKPEETSPLKSDKQSMEYCKESYRELIIQQGKETDHENGYRISDDNKLTKQYRLSFFSNDSPQVLEESEPGELLKQDKATSTLSFIEEQPQNAVIPLRESYYSKELTEQSISKRRSPQLLERESGYEESDKYRTSKDKQRESMKNQKDEVHRASYDNYKPEDISPQKIEKRNLKYVSGSYREPVIKQSKETENESGHRISDDKKQTEQYCSCFLLNEPPQVAEKPEFEDYAMQDLIARTFPISREQPQNSVRQLRESNFNKELTEQSTSKQGSTQPLERYAGYEELRDSKAFEKPDTVICGCNDYNCQDYQKARSTKYRRSKDKERESIVNKDLYEEESRKSLKDKRHIGSEVLRDSKAFEKPDTKIHRNSKDNDNKSYDTEKVNKEVKDHEEERCYKYRSSNDNERESITNKDLYDRDIRMSFKDQNAVMYRTSRENYKPEEILPLISEKRSVEYGRKSYRELIIQQGKETNHGNDYIISDDKKLTEQYHPSFLSNDSPQAVEEPKFDELALQDLISRTFSLPKKQQQDIVRQPRESNFSIELSEQSASKRRSIQPLERYGGFEELKDSKAFDSKDYQEARSSKYSKSKDKERDSIINMDLYEEQIRKSLQYQKDAVYRSPCDNYKPEEISPLESYREPIIQQEKETDHKNGYRISKEIEPLMLTKRSTEYDKDNYRESKTEQKRETCYENGHRISDDKAFEESEPGKLLQQNEAVRPLRKSYYDKEPIEQFTNNKRTTQPLDLCENNEDLRYDDDDSRRAKNTDSNDPPQVIEKSETYYRKEPSKSPRKNIICCCTKPLESDESYKKLSESKTFEKLDKNSKDIEREHYNDNMESLKVPNNKEHGTFAANEESKEISPRKLTKQRIEYDKESHENNNLSDEKFNALNRSSFCKEPEPYQTRQEHDNYSQLSSQAKQADTDDERIQRETPKGSTSFSYRDFRETMDDIGFYSETSMQANYTAENDLMQPVSTSTFTIEINAEEEPCMRQNTKEALQYLRGFLNSHQQFDLDEECLNSVRTAAEDLINKLSSCKMNKSTHTTSEVDAASRTEYKDPESIPNTSRSQLEQEKGNEVNDDNNGANTIAEKESPYHSDNQHWKPTEEYQRYLEYKQQMMTGSTPSVDVVSEDDHYQYLSSTQMPNRSQYFQNVSESLLTYDNKYDKEAPDEYDTNLPLSSNENKYYQSYSPQSRSTSVYSGEAMPIKGILKPSRAMENNQKVSCDLVTNATVSTHNFEHASQINMRKNTLLRCAQGQQEIEHETNESFQTVMDNDQNIQPSVEHSGHRHTVATATGEPLYQEYILQNNYVSNYDEADNNRFLYTVGLPSFRQCPCMLKTYLQMLETYYKAGNK